MELGETTEPELQGPEQGFWMRRLEAEHDNIRAALVWSLEREPVIALRLAQALYEFWWRNFQREGRDVLENALERATATPKEIRAKALRSLAQLTTDTETVSGYCQKVGLYSKNVISHRATLGHCTISATSPCLSSI
jgi:hypothetical protein